MSVLDFFKSKTSVPPSEKRCRHHYPNGSRCQLDIEEGSELFCGRHLKNGHLSQTDLSQDERESDLAAIYAEVMGPVQSLDSAVAINHILGNLFRLTLLGRIPQRKAVTLTTQLRALLRTAEAAKHEIVTAKLFPHNNADLLNLLALLNGEDAESETVAPNSSSAVFTAHNSISDSKSHHSVVAAEACAVSASRVPHGNRLGSGQTNDPEEPSKFSNANNRETVAPQSSLHRDRESGRTCAAVFSASNSISDTEPKHSISGSEPRGEPLASRASRGIAPLSGLHIDREGGRTCAAISTASTPTPAPTNSDELDVDPQHEFMNATEPAVSSSPIPPKPQSTTSVYDYSDGVCWIGPKPDQIDWARLEESKREYEHYLNTTYGVTFHGKRLIPPDKIPLWWKYRKPR